VALDLSFGVRRDLRLKASKDDEEARATSQEQMAMTGGHIGQPRAQLDEIAGACRKRARRSRFLCAYRCHRSPQCAVEPSFHDRNCKLY
jgi:hypothetical protein